MGELEKRIDLYFNILKDETYEDYIRNCVIRAFIVGEVEEMKKEFPNTTEITQAFTMISNLFPESHGFSKRHLEKFLTQLKEATDKWLGDEQPQQR